MLSLQENVEGTEENHHHHHHRHPLLQSASEPSDTSSDPGSPSSDPGSPDSGPGSPGSGPGSPGSGPGSLSSGPGSPSRRPHGRWSSYDENSKSTEVGCLGKECHSECITQCNAIPPLFAAERNECLAKCKETHQILNEGIPSEMTPSEITSPEPSILSNETNFYNPSHSFSHKHHQNQNGPYDANSKSVEIGCSGKEECLSYCTHQCSTIIFQNEKKDCLSKCTQTQQVMNEGVPSESMPQEVSITSEE